MMKKILTIFFLVWYFASASTSSSDGSNEVEPKAPIRLDPILRRALLRAITNLENEPPELSDEEDTTDYSTTEPSELLETGEDTDVNSSTQDSVADQEPSVQYHSFVVDGQKAFDASSNDSSKNNNIDAQITNDGKENDIRFQTPDPIIDDDIETKESSNLNTLTQSRSIQSESSAKNIVLPKLLQPPKLPKIKSQKIATTTPKFTTTTSTTPKPKYNEDGENIEQLEDHEVQVFQAPLVAAFTVHQDSQGLPRSVIPIYKQAIRAPIPPLLPASRLSSQSLQQSSIQQSIQQSPIHLLSNNQQTQNQQQSQIEQQLALQQQLEQKQRILEEQLRQLQKQQKQQEELLKQQQLLHQQQLLLTQNERKRQQQIIDEEQQRQRQQQYYEQQKQIQQQNLVRIDQYQQLQQQYQQQQQQQFQQQQKQQQQLQLQQKQQYQQQQQQQQQQQLQQNQQLQQTQQQFPRAQNQLSSTSVSFQPSISIQPNSGITAQQLPQREAVDFLVHLRSRQPSQFPLQNGGPIPPSGQQQLPIDKSNQNAFNEIATRQSSSSTRVFRQEPTTGNFGFNTNKLYNNNNNYYQVDSVNNRNFRTQQPQNRFRGDTELKSLLYQSGLTNGGRSQEDLSIVSKVLSLNHGVVPRGNFLSEDLDFLFGESRKNEASVKPSNDNN